MIFFRNCRISGFIEALLSGNIKIDKENFLKRVFNVFNKELKNSSLLLFKVITICIFCSVIKHIQTGNDKGATETAFYVCYLIISILIISNFIIIVNLCISTMKLLNSFNGVIVPIIFIYLTISGNIVTASVLQGTVMFFASFISNACIVFFIPIIIASTILEIVSNISEIVDTSKIGKFFKKSTLFIIEVSLIVFVGLLSIEGSLTSSVDGTTAKATKSIVSTVVPVVGKLIRRCF